MRNRAHNCNFDNVHEIKSLYLVTLKKLKIDTLVLLLILAHGSVGVHANAGHVTSIAHIIVVKHRCAP